jgi:hypothetical protein
VPRIRTLKPEHRQHRKIGPLDHVTYRLWVGMILEADDWGRLVCEPEQLRVIVFGYHPKVTRSVVDDSLTALESSGLIRRYRVGGVTYADFPSWRDHQVISHPAKSKLPEYQDSRNAPESSGTFQNLPLGKEGNGKEGNGKEGALVVLSDDQFLASLKTNPAYQGIDLDHELAKMDAWLLTPRARGRKKTRQFIVNWLNRVDRPVAAEDAPVIGNAPVLRRFLERHGETP